MVDWIKNYGEDFEKVARKFLAQNKIFYDKKAKRYRSKVTGRFVDICTLEWVKGLT